MADVDLVEVAAIKRDYLTSKLTHEQQRFDALDAWDRGSHPLPHLPRRQKDNFRAMQRQARSNFVGLVTDAVLDRLQVIGFGVDGGDGDAEVWRLWGQTAMDADQDLATRDALAMSRGYVMVGGDERGVTVTDEDPRFLTVDVDPVDRRRVRSALKVWSDETQNRSYCVLYLPTTVHYYTSTPTSRHASTYQGDVLDPRSVGSWQVDESEGDGGVAPNPLGEVPVVAFVNRPDKRRGGFGEFEDVVDIQARINQSQLDRIVTSWAQAFRQRWASGMSQDEFDEIDPGADLIWAVADPSAKFGDFTSADIRQFLESAGKDIEQMAAITRTPPYYLVGEMVNVSGDALTAADAGLAAKARRRQGQFGRAWADVMRLAVRVDTGTDPGPLTTMWADAERRSEAAKADVVSKLTGTAGLGPRLALEYFGFTPAEIARNKADVGSLALLQSALGQGDDKGKDESGDG